MTFKITESLGTEIAGALNDATQEAMLNDVVTAFRAGDAVLQAAVNNLRVDARAWFDQALAAAGTLDSGLQKTQLEAILSELMSQPAFHQAIGGKTVVIDGTSYTLTSALEALTINRPAIASEDFARDANGLPTGETVTFADGRQSVFAGVTTDDGAGVLTFAFSTTDFLGVPASFEQKVRYTVRAFLGTDRKHFVEIRRSRVVFDLTSFFVAGSDPVAIVPNGLDLDGNTTTDGTSPAPAPAPAPAPNPADPAIAALQAQADADAQAVTVTQSAVNSAEAIVASQTLSLQIAEGSGDAQAIADAQAAKDTADANLATAQANHAAAVAAAATSAAALAAALQP